MYLANFKNFLFLRISHEFDEKWEGFLLGNNCFPLYTVDRFLNLFCSRHTNIKLILKSLFEETVAASGISCRRTYGGIKELSWITEMIRDCD